MQKETMVETGYALGFGAAGFMLLGGAYGFLGGAAAGALFIMLNSCFTWKTLLPVQAFLAASVLTGAERIFFFLRGAWTGLSGGFAPMHFLIWTAAAMPLLVLLDWLLYWFTGGERPVYAFVRIVKK